MKESNKLPRKQQIEMDEKLKALGALSKTELLDTMVDGAILYEFACTPGAPISGLLDLLINQGGDEGVKLFETLCFANLVREKSSYTKISLGHLIAGNQNQKAFTHFLDLACQHFPAKLAKLLMTSRVEDGERLSVLSLLAKKKRDSLILDCFQRLNTHCPAEMEAVITKKQHYMNNSGIVRGRQIFLLAFNMEAASLTELLALVAHNPDTFATVIKKGERDFPGKYLSHMLALKGDSGAFNQFLDLVVKCDPQLLPFLLNTKDNEYRSMVHRLWQMRSTSSLLKLIDLVISHAPASLNSLLRTENTPYLFSIINLLDQQPDSTKGRIIFKMIDSSIPLDSYVNQYLRKNRWAVLAYMKTLPPQERKEVISKCFKKGSAWRAYFDIQDHYLCSIFHNSKDLKRELRAMQKAADQEMAEASSATPAAAQA